MVLLPVSKRTRGLLAYHIPKAATGNTRENVSYYLCCAPKWFKQKSFIWFYMIVFTVRILFFERHTHNVNQCHTQKYARQACRQPVLCIKKIYIYILYITDITRLSPTWSHHGKRSFLQSPWDKTFEGMRMLGKEWKHHLSCVLLRTSGYIASVRPLCCCCVTEICLVGYLHLDLIWCREGIVQRSCMYQVLLSLLVLDYRCCKRLLKTKLNYS